MMTLDEADRLLNAVGDACPGQRITAEMPERWRGVLHDVSFADCMKAVTALAELREVIEPPDIREALYRKRAEPGGEIYFEALARRGGKPYTGGAVCWDPADCQGICRECRVPREEAS